MHRVAVEASEPPQHYTDISAAEFFHAAAKRIPLPQAATTMEKVLPRLNILDSRVVLLRIIPVMQNAQLVWLFRRVDLPLSLPVTAHPSVRHPFFLRWWLLSTPPLPSTKGPERCRAER